MVPGPLPQALYPGTGTGASPPTPCYFPAFHLIGAGISPPSLISFFPGTYLSSSQVPMFFHSQLHGFLHTLSLLSLLPPLAASPMDPFKVSLIPQTTRDAFPKLSLTRGLQTPSLCMQRALQMGLNGDSCILAMLMNKYFIYSTCQVEQSVLKPKS